MALNLQERGFAVTVADVDAAAMAFFKQNWLSVTDFIHFVATQIVVIISVVNAEQIHEILFGEPGEGPQSHHGLAASLCPGSTVLITSTIGPDDLQRFAAALHARGIHTIEARRVFEHRRVTTLAHISNDAGDRAVDRRVGLC